MNRIHTLTHECTQPHAHIIGVRAAIGARTFTSSASSQVKQASGWTIGTVATTAAVITYTQIDQVGKYDVTCDVVCGIMFRITLTCNV